ncbi:hypothetical protein RhiirA1_497365 [Rhizophagus irregularis]|uniref:MIR domain-containing protein n=1 Tax=Rhizophagus irregularis TaxID=588596 RepID=A0A2N0S6Z0_9GLOM|nr:hypothetical protein RhiirA1_497365 [Rhizophagus irregularis]
MDIPKYDGNIHPDEWINDIQKYLKLRYTGDNYLNIAISLVDSNIISLPTKIDSFEELRDVLKEDISFTVFKCTNKRRTKKLFCNTLPKLPNKNDTDCYNYLLEFIKRREKIKSMNDLVKEFAEIIADELNLIRNESIIALKHVATGKYLSSIKNLCYTTGSKLQLAFAGSPEPDLNALWKIEFSGKLPMYNKTFIQLRHIKSGSVLGFYNDYGYNDYCKSPITEHTEVCCNGNENLWKFKHSKLENHQGYLKSNDIINLSITKRYNKVEFLRSHDVQFTIGNDTFQEVVCHSERLGGNDERKKKIKSMNDLVKEFAKIIADESNLIRNNSIVALKHVATGKYLSSIDNLCYTTGSKNQLAFAGSPERDLNALWKITFKEKFPIMYNKTSIKLRHIKSGNVLGLCNFYKDGFFYHKSPITEHTEVVH